MDLESLRARHEKLKRNSDITLENMRKLENESRRVADIAHNSKEILDDLDREFEKKTGLHGDDVKFLFAAVGLQVARIVILNELTKVQPAGANNRNETELHKVQEKLLGKLYDGQNAEERPYFASMEHIVTRAGVPYDATAPLSSKSIRQLLDKDFDCAYSPDELLPNESPELFKGANHRFATLGHDPILGLVFGTANIMTNTITCVKKVKGIPLLTTNHVVYTSDFKHPRIAVYGSTAVMLQQAIQRTMDQSSAFVAALIKQIIHIGTDMYTPAGIQIPGANLVLSNTEAERLTKYISTGDLLKAGVSAKLAELINLLISTVHTLQCDRTLSETEQKLYNVRTRKIILYSNAIATGSNVLWVGCNMAAGNESAIKQLDIGGFIVMIKRLISDTKFIQQIKEEFVFGRFNTLICGEDLGLEKITWD